MKKNRNNSNNVLSIQKNTVLSSIFLWNDSSHTRKVYLLVAVGKPIRKIVRNPRADHPIAVSRLVELLNDLVKVHANLLGFGLPMCGLRSWI
jgi:hypothetical protein